MVRLVNALKLTYIVIYVTRGGVGSAVPVLPGSERLEILGSDNLVIGIIAAIIIPGTSELVHVAPSTVAQLFCWIRDRMKFRVIGHLEMDAIWFVARFDVFRFRIVVRLLRIHCLLLRCQFLCKPTVNRGPYG
jgi:hypothetical protein